MEEKEVFSSTDEFVVSRLCAVFEDKGIRRLTPLECERLQGYPDGWETGL